MVLVVFVVRWLGWWRLGWWCCGAGVGGVVGAGDQDQVKTIDIYQEPAPLN